jgi:lysophospholipase L1-like esterase
MRRLAPAVVFLALTGSAHAATVSVSPSSALNDGQVVTVSGDGFAPYEPISVGECVVGKTCPAVDSSWTADEDGRFTVPYVVARDMFARDSTADCFVAQCAIAVRGSGRQAPAPVPITFSFGSVLPALEVHLNTNPRMQIDPRTGAAVVRGTLTCNRPGLVTLVARVAERSALGGTGGLKNLVCKTGRNRWRADVFAGGSFVPGHARLSVTMKARGNAGGSLTNGATLAGRRPAGYYLALGDSLAQGSAVPPGRLYPQRLLARLTPGLQLVNYGCSGATTISLIKNGCSRSRRSQLELAESVARRHRGALRLITIDVGGNDVVSCTRPGGADPACVDRALATVRANLTTIVSRLRVAAGPSVPIVTMTYYDPSLVYWFAGAPGQTQARNSVGVVDRLSAVIKSVYGRFDGKVADVEAAFQTSDFTLLRDSAWGQIPINVERVCRWLGATCPQPGTNVMPNPGLEANASGAQAIADAMAKLITCSPTSCAGSARRASSAARAARAPSAA